MIDVVTAYEGDDGSLRDEDLARQRALASCTLISQASEDRLAPGTDHVPASGEADEADDAVEDHDLLESTGPAVALFDHAQELARLTLVINGLVFDYVELGCRCIWTGRRRRGRSIDLEDSRQRGRLRRCKDVEPAARRVGEGGPEN